MTFQPEDITGVVEAWVADDLGLSDGAAVGGTGATWQGRVHHYALAQGDSTKQPHYRTSGIAGQPAVEFDGTNDLLRYAGTLSTADSGRVFAVVRFNSLAGGTADVWGSADESGSTNTYWIQGQVTTAGVLRIAQDDNDLLDDVLADASHTITTATDYFLEWGSTAHAYELRVNASAGILGTPPVVGSNTGDWFDDTAFRDSFTIGALKRGAEGPFLNGKIAALIVVDGSISLVDRRRLYSWAQAKYNVNLGASNQDVFQPEQVAGVAEVWVANDVAQADGSPVTQWVGRVAGTTMVQTDATKQPVYRSSSTINSVPALDFDGTNDLLVYTASNPVSTALSGGVWTVLWFDAQNGRTMWSSANSATDSTYIYGNNAPSTWHWRLAQRNGAGDPVDTLDSLTVPEKDRTYVFEVSSDGVEYSMRVHNADRVLNATTGTDAGDWFGDTVGRNVFAVGALKTNTEDLFFDGRLAFLFVINGQPSENDRNSLVAWINNQYGEVLDPVDDSNNLFADAVDIALIGDGDQPSGTSFADNTGYTRETGETDPVAHADFRTAWWKFTPVSDCAMRLDTHGSEINTVLSGWTGTTVDALAHVDSNQDSLYYGSQASSLNLKLTGGTTYHFKIGSPNTGLQGVIALNWQIADFAADAGTNDAFVNATNLGSAAALEVYGNTDGATTEGGEPDSPQIPGTPHHTVWFKWTCPGSDRLDVSVDWRWTNIATYVEFFSASGPAIGDLLFIDTSAGSPQPFVFRAEPGATYYIRSAAVADTGPVWLSLSTVTANPPVNDYFAGATNLGSATAGSNVVSSAGAALEPNEPNPAAFLPRQGPSLWWKWTCPASGVSTVTWSTVGSIAANAVDPFDTILLIYTGTNFSNLVELTHNDNGVGTVTSQLTFTTTPLQTYWIVVAARVPQQTGEVHLSWTTSVVAGGGAGSARVGIPAAGTSAPDGAAP